MRFRLSVATNSLNTFCYSNAIYSIFSNFLNVCLQVHGWWMYWGGNHRGKPQLSAVQHMNQYATWQDCVTQHSGFVSQLPGPKGAASSLQSLQYTVWGDERNTRTVCINKITFLIWCKVTIAMKDGWMNGVLGHFYALSRLNWAGGNLG